MENKSNDSLIKNNLFKKINFESYSNKCSYRISKSLYLVLFLKICILLYLFIYLIYELKRQNNDIKKIISLFRKYFANEQSFVSSNNKNEEVELYLDKYETDKKYSTQISMQ
jgi:hypothetical protein